MQIVAFCDFTGVRFIKKYFQIDYVVSPVLK